MIARSPLHRSNIWPDPGGYPLAVRLIGGTLNGEIHHIYGTHLIGPSYIEVDGSMTPGNIYTFVVLSSGEIIGVANTLRRPPT